MQRHPLTALAASLLIAWSCSTHGPVAPATSATRTDVLLTDAPASAAGIGSVNVYIVSIDASETSDTTGGAGSQPFTTLVAPHRRFDLMALQNGTAALMGTAQVTPVVYKAIRVVLNTDSSGIVRTDGSSAPVHWGSAGQIALHTTLDTPVQISGSAVRILLDFNVANSFPPDPQDPTGFVFLPWIHVTVSGS